MSTNGILDFQNTNKIIFRGSDSNVVIDTSNVSLGIGIQGTETPGSNLHVVGDAYISSNLKLTTDTSILVNSNVVTNFSGPHARLPKAVPLKKYPDIIFVDGKFDSNDSTNTYVQAGYTVSASSQDYRSSRSPWCAFDDNDSTHQEFNAAVHLYDGGNGTNPGFATTNALETTNVDGSGTYRGEWLQIELPNKIKLNKYVLGKRASTYAGIITKEGKVLGSNDGTNWTTVYDHNDTQGPYSTSATIVEKRIFQVNSSSYYKYFRLATNKLFPTGLINNDTMTPNIAEWSLYGYEEDPPFLGDTSIDTTFTSIMNTPQTTGANVYVDSKLSSDFTNQVTGPTPVGTVAVHDNTNKYWEMNGQLTSNITVEANTFLEGDQPHAVSVWFNSSNLEANVSNTCVFSVSDQEKLDSVNLDLQSNTWHNLTYAYQGEGGSRVTYLDGRKVAEDQAEDTFGDYPPFAMTGYSQGGYVVSASSEASSGTRNAFKAFDKSAPSAFSAWSTQEGFTSGVYSSGGSSFTLNGSPQSGHWLKIELPHKLHVSYVEIIENGNAGFKPTSGFLIGSNDDQNWDVLKQYSGLTYPGSDYKATIVSESSKAYKYILLLIQTLDTNSGTYTFIEDFHIYGHRENDLVRLPDPTNVLKYPHVVMTGPARRGYVASASDITSDAPEWYAFDGVSSTRWRGSGGQYTNGDANSTVQLSSSSSTPNGSWIKVEFPHKLKINKMRISGVTTQSPKDGELWASNNDSDWTQIFTFSNMANGSAGNFTDFNFTPLSSDYFKYFALIVTKTGATNETLTSIYELEYYGTGVDSIPIQIGGGNIDKVANFRVYDKFVGEDQALEIWDAQKDEFGRAKSSMTLHKGRLGIGTTEPQGRLAVLDEPHNLEEFPPSAMSAYKNYFEGHGEFCASSSSVYQNSSSLYLPYMAFDKKFDTSTSFNLQTFNSGQTYTVGTGEYPATASAKLGSFRGEWLLLELPYKIKLVKFSLSILDDWATNAPKDFVVAAYDEDTTEWVELVSYVGELWPNPVSGTHEIIKNKSINSTSYYKKYALVTSKIGSGANNMNIAEWRLFGTREQGQSVLHDGQLTLTKNLTVPRIGPALDADDTPRRDRLVVEYNTSTNPTFEGAVRDTSGRGNDGFAPNVSYLNKSLWFPGNGKINGKHTLGEGTGITLTISLWFKLNSTGNQRIVIIGDQNTQYKSINVTYFSNRIGLDYWLSEVQTPAGSVSTGQWYHMVIVHKGPGTTATGSQDIYLNNVKQTLNLHASNNSNSTFDLLGDGLVLGSDAGAGGTYLSGYISQFKLYDTALTAEEVKTLYDMGRMGSVANPQPLHIAAPLYSPGTIVQVESATMIDTWSSSLASSAAVAATTFLDVEGMSVNIHPKFSNSKFLISYHANIGGNNGHVALRLKRTRNGVETYLAQPTAGQNRMKGTAYLHSRQTTLHCFSLEHLDNPGNDTGDITYQLVAHSKRGDAYYIHLNKSHTDTNNEYYGRSSSTITVKEICQ